MGTFFGLQVALSGLQAQQRALMTISHNITNATTEGYSRQRVELQANAPYTNPALNSPLGAGQLGTGVTIAQMNRMRDTFIDASFRATTSSHGQFDARSEALAAIDVILNEPGNAGLAALLSDHWGAWQSLTTQPDSAGAREAVRRTGEALADGMGDLAGEFTRATTDAGSRITLQVGRANQIAGQVNTLNLQIAKSVAFGDSPNDLRDQRDKLLDELAGLTDITVTENTAGKVSVAIGGQLLLDATTDTANALAIDAAGAATVGGVGTTITTGSLRGQVDIRNSVVGGATGYLAQLDTFAAALIASVNTQHAAGFGLDGTTGNNFFSGTSASTIALDAAIAGTVDKIAASDTAGNLPGGADNALAIAQLQFLVQSIGGQTTTIDGYYQGLVSRIGVDVDQDRRLTEVQAGVLEAVRARRESVSGVSIDEEAAEMIRFQKSYNAAARMVTTIDEMLDTIVNRMGLVGR